MPSATPSTGTSPTRTTPADSNTGQSSQSQSPAVAELQTACDGAHDQQQSLGATLSSTPTHRARTAAPVSPDRRLAYRQPPAVYQDSSTFDARRKEALDKRRHNHLSAVAAVRSKWEAHAKLERAREEELLERRRHTAAERSVGDAWVLPVLLGLHFQRAFAEEANMIRATTNLRFFFLPMCILYLRRVRRRMALRRAFRDASAAGGAGIHTPSVEVLRASSPALVKWPDAHLQALIDAMKPEFFFDGSILHLSGEPSRRGWLHFIARGLVVTSDATERHIGGKDAKTVGGGGLGYMVHNPHTVASLVAGSEARRHANGEQQTQRPPQGPSHRDHHMYYVESGTLIGEYAVTMGECFANNSFVSRGEVIAYSIPADVYLQQLQCLPSGVQSDTIATCKHRFKRRMLNNPRPRGEELLASHPFFRGWPLDPVRFLMDTAAPSSVRPGERLYRDNRTTNRIFFVSQGTVSTHVGRAARSASSVSAGALLGTASVVPHVADVSFLGDMTAVASTYCELWAIPRQEVLNSMHRCGMYARLSDEFHSVFAPHIPRPTPELLRKTNVFSTLPDRPLATLAAKFKVQHVLPETPLVKMDAMVQEVLYVAWGSLQLVMVHPTSFERKSVGEVLPGHVFGAPEVLAQATAPVAVSAPHGAIVLVASKEDVYSAIEAAGESVFLAALDRANQQVGSRGAEARARVERTLQHAQAQKDRAAGDPELQREHSRQAALARVRAVRKAAEAKQEVAPPHTPAAMEHQDIVRRLTQHAQRSREVQKLTVEHRVFACIKDQVYGGRRREHTELVSQHYARPTDNEYPVYAPTEDELKAKWQQEAAELRAPLSPLSRALSARSQSPRTETVGTYGEDTAPRESPSPTPTVSDIQPPQLPALRSPASRRTGSATGNRSDVASTAVVRVVAFDESSGKYVEQRANSGAAPTTAGHSDVGWVSDAIEVTLSSKALGTTAKSRSEAAADARYRSVAADLTGKRMTDRLPLPSTAAPQSLTVVPDPMPALTAAARELQARREKAPPVVRDAVGSAGGGVLVLTSQPPPVVMPLADDATRLERRHLLEHVELRAKARRQQYSEGLQSLFTTAGVPVASLRRDLPPSCTIPRLPMAPHHRTLLGMKPPATMKAIQPSTARPTLPLPSRLDYAALGPSSVEAEDVMLQSSDAGTQRGSKTARKPLASTPSPDEPDRRVAGLKITVDPTKGGRAQGGGPAQRPGAFRKGRPEQGVVPRVPAPPRGQEDLQTRSVRRR